MTDILLKIDDSRRLTGKNFFSDKPGTVLDALVSGVDKQTVVDLWLEQLDGLLTETDLSASKRFYRLFEDGVSVGFTAPTDALYAATEINESAWNRMKRLMLSDSNYDLGPGPDLTNAELIQLIRDESNPQLLSLIAAAEANDIVYLVDDDAFSLGYGAGSETWNINALPDLDTLDFTKYKTVPIALVTGTNGKSTSVRLSSQIIKQAGLRCGVTSTDFIRVGDTILDTGDYSGPGGARMLLRHPDTEAAVLEVARGGLLRRGLPIPQVEVALVTNIAEDHLGQYGINSIAALTTAKMIVAKADCKSLVLNADDENLVAFVDKSKAKAEADRVSSASTSSVSIVDLAPLASRLPERITWFSLDESNPVIIEARSQQQNVCFVRNDQIIYATPSDETNIIDINDIPMTLQGAAVHNVQNALAAVALSKALDIDTRPIREALAQFRSDVTDNPGRGNLFEYQGAKLMLDFAHNVHSMNAMASTLRNMPAARKILLLCMAGDRADSDVRKMVHSAMTMQPDLVWVCELPNYLRGRELGSLSNVIASAVRETGLIDSAIHFASDPLQGAEAIIKQLQADDLVFIMALSQRDDIATLMS